MGLVTSISGGAGVFAVPTMLAFGLPPINVLALNRISDVGTVFGALRAYYKSKSIDWKLAGIIAIPLAIGSFFGASVVVRLPTEILKYVILVGVVIGIFFLLKRRTKLKTKPSKNMISWIGLFLMLLVGIWSGALGMAGAIFAVLILVYFFHKRYLQARSTKIAAAIPETLISATILVMASTTSFLILSTMFISSFVGSWIGSHLAVKRGDNFIRRVMVGIAIVMIIKVIIDIAI